MIMNITIIVTLHFLRFRFVCSTISGPLFWLHCSFSFFYRFRFFLNLAMAPLPRTPEDLA